MINTAAITGLYDALTGAITTKLDNLYTSDKIDAETYAKLLAQSFDEALKLSVSAIQQQEAQEKDYEIKNAQVVNLGAEKFRIEAQTAQIEAETINIGKQGSLIEAQTEVQAQQRLNLISEELRIDAQTAQITAETLNVPKQGSLIDAQKEVQTQQKLNLVAEKLRVEEQTKQITAEVLNIPKQGVVLDKQALDIAAKTELTGQQKTNLIAEALNIPKQGSLIDSQTDVQVQQKTNLAAEKLSIDARTGLTGQQKSNLVAEALNIPKVGAKLDAEKLLIEDESCLRKAQFDLTVENKLKTASETSLLNQKKTTEIAQVQASGVDPDSVIGRQKALYAAQANGFARDAEQKAADLMIKSWIARKTTDDTTPVSADNKLQDVFVGQAVGKLLNGIGA